MVDEMAGGSTIPPAHLAQDERRLSPARLWPALPAVLVLGVLFLGAMAFMVVFMIALSPIAVDRRP